MTQDDITLFNVLSAWEWNRMKMICLEQKHTSEEYIRVLHISKTGLTKIVCVYKKCIGEC